MGNQTQDWQPFSTLQGLVRLILLVDWDPIGVFGFAKAMDEYDSYAEDICSLLLSGVTRTVLIDHLDRIEKQQMGGPGERTILGIVADKLLFALRRQKEVGNAVSPDISRSGLLWTGGKIDRVTVSLRFLGTDLNPEIISALLGCEPTKAHRKGDRVIGKRSRREAPTGSWIYRFPDIGNLPLEEQLRRLFDSLTDDLALWAQAASMGKGDVLCGLFLNEWNRGLDLSLDVLKLLADRHLAVGLDIYCNYAEGSI